MNQPKQPPHQSPLPITIVPGMTVVAVDDGTSGTIVGITDGHCIFRGDRTGGIAVSAWPTLALANVRPAKQLLPSDVTENDRCNAQATVLRELLELKPFGLSDRQQASMDELLAALCPGQA